MTSIPLEDHFLQTFLVFWQIHKKTETTLNRKINGILEKTNLAGFLRGKRNTHLVSWQVCFSYFLKWHKQNWQFSTTDRFLELSGYAKMAQVSHAIIFLKKIFFSFMFWSLSLCNIKKIHRADPELWECVLFRTKMA